MSTQPTNIALIQGYCNPNYWHVVQAGVDDQSPQYLGCLPFVEAIAIIRTLGMMMDIPSSVDLYGNNQPVRKFAIN